MSYVTLNFDLLAGQDLFWNRELEDFKGVPINITGYSFEYIYVGTGCDKEDVVVNDSTSPDTTIITDAINGKFRIHITDTTLDALDRGNYKYTLFLIDTEGIRYPMQTGLMRLKDTPTGA